MRVVCQPWEGVEKVRVVGEKGSREWRKRRMGKKRERSGRCLWRGERWMGSRGLIEEEPILG